MVNFKMFLGYKIKAVDVVYALCTLSHGVLLITDGLLMTWEEEDLMAVVHTVEDLRAVAGLVGRPVTWSSKASTDTRLTVDGSLHLLRNKTGLNLDPETREWNSKWCHSRF